MLLPNTPGGVAAAKTLKELQASRAANTIQGSSKTALASDEFLSFSDVDAQLEKLRVYCQTQRDAHASYSIPRPCGWKLSVLILQPPTKTAGGLEIPDDVTEAYAHKSVQGVVIALGHTAFSDQTRFPSGPWCRIGDRIIFKRYDAQLFDLANGQRIGIMNDTQPIGVMGGTFNVMGVM